MKLNGTPRHYMPLSQNQSDEDESGPSKEEKGSTIIFKSSFAASTVLTKTAVPLQIVKMNAKDLPMSPLRRLLFIVSLITCVLFVVIFVYFVPCSMTKTFDRSFGLTYKWKRIFHNMTFAAPLEFVTNNISGISLVILGCNSGESNLIAIQKNNGKEHWKLNFHSPPLSSYCNALDLNLDGMPECLIIGNKGLFAAIDVEKGSTLWYLHNHSDILNAYSVYEPTIVPDCDEDGVLDIVISYYVDEENKKSSLAFVSGATGQIVGSLLDLSQCTGPITKTIPWKFQNESYIILYCSGYGISNLWMLSSKEACDKALKNSSKFSVKNIFRMPPFTQDIQIFTLSSYKEQLLIVLDQVKFLLLEALQETFHLKWETYVQEHQHLKIISDGQFVKGSYQIVVAAVNLISSKILGIDVNNGKVTYLGQVNESVQEGVKLPNYFGDIDGLILKTTSFINSYESRDSFQDSNKNLRESNKNENLDFDYKNETKTLIENFIVFKCGKVSLSKIIHSEKLLISCKDKGCQSDTYNIEPSVLVKKNEIDYSFDVMTVTSTILPASTYGEEMIVNFFNLKNISIWSTCSG